jgi:hypothetical protein
VLAVEDEGRKMDKKTVDHVDHPGVQRCAEAILEILLEEGPQTGISETGRLADWVVCTRVITAKVHGLNPRDVTTRGGGSYWAEYFRTMCALALLETNELVVLHRDVKGKEIIRVELS